MNKLIDIIEKGKSNKKIILLLFSSFRTEKIAQWFDFGDRPIIANEHSTKAFTNSIEGHWFAAIEKSQNYQWIWWTSASTGIDSNSVGQSTLQRGIEIQIHNLFGGFLWGLFYFPFCFWIFPNIKVIVHHPKTFCHFVVPTGLGEEIQFEYFVCCLRNIQHYCIGHKKDWGWFYFYI